MTVSHYSCLELLSQRPGLSNSDLARGTFVTRQSMNVLLQSLERDGFVTRPAQAPVGKALPTSLTPAGRRRLAQATVAVRAVEKEMLEGLTDQDQVTIRRILSAFIEALTQPKVDQGR
jgi:DNA-binding MarR family transcriptional regulator